MSNVKYIPTKLFNCLDMTDGVLLHTYTQGIPGFHQELLRRKFKWMLKYLENEDCLPYECCGYCNPVLTPSGKVRPQAIQIIKVPLVVDKTELLDSVETCLYSSLLEGMPKIIYCRQTDLGIYISEIADKYPTIAFKVYTQD